MVAKLEGDAVLSYSEDGVLRVGQTLVEMIEATYVAFRRAIDLMVLNNTCGCNACANVSTLDLKFFVHHGAFATQQSGRYVELVGNDVNVIHRLLKNTIAETTGVRAYTAYTDAALDQMGRELTDGLTRVEGSYPDVGEITLWIQDMHPVWEAKKDESIVEIPEKEIAVSIEVEFGLPVEVVWDYLADLGFRKIIIGSDSQEVLDRQRGRVDVGSTYKCYHGDRIVNQLVLEWRPFERIVTRDRIGGVMGDLQVHNIFELRPYDGGTILTQKAGGFVGPALRRRIGPSVLKMMRGQFQRDGEAFRQALETDYARRGPLVVPG